MIYNRVLVPLDGSKLAEGALPYARLLAGALQLPVDLLHVNDPETFPPSNARGRLPERSGSVVADLFDREFLR